MIFKMLLGKLLVEICNSDIEIVHTRHLSYSLETNKWHFMLTYPRMKALSTIQSFHIGM